MNTEAADQSGEMVPWPADPWMEGIFGMLYTFEQDAGGRWTFPWASRGCEELLEMGAGELAAYPERAFALLHPEDHQKVVDSIKASARDLSPYHEEWRVLLPKAGERWLRCKSIPEDMGGGVLRWRGQMIDVTDWKRSERGWMQTAQMLSMVADANPGALFMGKPSSDGPEHHVELPYVSSGVARVFGVEPREAMDDSSSIWRLFSPSERQKGMDAFEEARKSGSASALLDCCPRDGEPIQVAFSVEWAQSGPGGEWLWVGSAAKQGESDAARKAWECFSKAQEALIGGGFLDGLCAALAEALQASSCKAEWFDEPLGWEVEAGAEVQWQGDWVKLAILDEARRPLGKVEARWLGESPRDMDPMLLRVAALAKAHWGKRRKEIDLQESFEAARVDLERSSKAASMGALVEGLAHDLSTPLGNGALSIEVVQSRAAKIEALLSQERVNKSELEKLAHGLAEISMVALSEVDKARRLLESLKKIASEQMRSGKSKHELGALLSDMRSSLHPTLRKRGIDLSVEAAQGEIWARVDVSATFSWLAACAQAASGDGLGAFESSARVSVQAQWSLGRARLAFFMDPQRAEWVERAMGLVSIEASGGRREVILDLGEAQSSWGPVD